MLSRLFKAGEKVLWNLVNKKDLHMASKNSPKAQELCDFCKETFTGIAPSPGSMAVQKLCSLLGIFVSLLLLSLTAIELCSS